MNELYIQDSLDEDFQSYIKKYIIGVNSDTVADQHKNHLVRDYVIPFIPVKRGNKQKIKAFSGNSQRKMIFTLTNASAR